MNLEQNPKVKIVCNIQKAYTAFDQAAQKTRYFVSGVASGVKVDLEHERMAESAVLSLKSTIENGVVTRSGVRGPLPLRNEHQHGWNDVLGHLVSAEIDKSWDITVVAELDMDNPNAAYLYKKLSLPDDERPRLGFSVGGYVLDAGEEYNAELGKFIRVYRGVGWEEISVTGQPAYDYSYISALAKALNRSKFKGEVESTMDEENVVNADVEKAATEIEGTEPVVAAAESVEVAEAQVEKSTDATDADAPAEDVAKDAGDEVAGETVEKDMMGDGSDAESPLEDAVDDALLTAANDVISQISSLVNSYQYMRYEMDYMISTLLGKGLVTQENLDLVRKGEQPVIADVEKSEAEVEAPAEVEKAVEEAPVAEAAEEVAKSETEVAPAVEAAPVEKAAPAFDFEKLGEMLKAVLAPIEKRLEEIESAPVDKSLSVTKAKDAAETPMDVYKSLATEGKDEHGKPLTSIGAAIRTSRALQGS